MAMITNPHFYENAALVILVGGLILVLAGLVDLALSIKPYFDHPGASEGLLEVVSRVAVWTVRTTMDGLIMTVIGIGVCIGVARYLRSSGYES